MTTIQEVIQNESALQDALKNAIKQEIRCAMPGIVKDYDADTQTASVQLAIRDARKTESYEDLPILMDVPVYFPGGGKVRIVYDVSPGDECLVIFADACIDGWQQYGHIANPIFPRRHDLSDGFALVGFSSRPNQIPADNNVFSLRVKVQDEWKTPIAVDQNGHVLLEGEPVSGR